MSKLKDLLTKEKISRRSVLKGMGAAATTATLAGCGDGSGAKDYFEDTNNVFSPDPVEGTVFKGATPHNCGGRCASSYYVEEGVIKRIVTDEDNEDLDFDNGNDPQRRTCVRCRSRKEWFYRADRLMKPLKQTGARGDINGFVEISWEQAGQEIGQKLIDLKNTYNEDTYIWDGYASGDATGWARDSGRRLAMMLGARMPTRNDYSWPAIEHVPQIMTGEWVMLGNTKSDIFNAEQIVFWSYNGTEAVLGNNSSWFWTQARDAGIGIYSVDSRVSMTSATLADEMMAPVPGTDAALLMAMMYHLIDSTWDVDGNLKQNALLGAADINNIDKYVHGFFDNTLTDAYHGEADYPGVDSYKVVPDGGSLSAFVMGTDPRLTIAVFPDSATPLNNGTSIYPETIGYDVNADDPLNGQRTGIYGQAPKTPEWAEKITGVPAEQIHELAERLMTQKCSIIVSTGFQRNTESEGPVWLLRLMSVITGNFGEAGASCGMLNWSYIGGPGNKMYDGTGIQDWGFANISDGNYDDSKRTVPSHNTATSGSIPVFTWLDAIENGGTGTSRWNDGQIKALKQPIKAILNFAGNVILNQHGDIPMAENILADRSLCELIVTCDHFMTNSALWSDYVLPGAMAMEKEAGVTGWHSEEIIAIQKVMDPPGDALHEYEIGAHIARGMGMEAEYRNVGDPIQQVADNWAAGSFDVDYETFKANGIYKQAPVTAIPHEAFKADPSANPLSTPTGKFEAYCLSMMEDYQARGHENIDPFGTLESGLIADATAPAGSDSMRFVYPIPMYIPLVEGRHAIDSIDPEDSLVHPDPAGSIAKGYHFNLHTWHIMYRSHSSLNKVAYLNELYKQDGQGQAAFIPGSNTTLNTWEADVYETVWINSDHSQDLGLRDGDRVKISNDRGKIYASVVLTQTVPKHYLCIGQGGWRQLNGSGVDIGGCANTLTPGRPSRICRGMTSATDARVKIEKD